MAQDLSELARGEFARSAGAADHLGQPLFVREERHLLIVVGYGAARSLAAIGYVALASLRFRLADRVRPLASLRSLADRVQNR